MQELILGIVTGVYLIIMYFMSKYNQSCIKDLKDSHSSEIRGIRKSQLLNEMRYNLESNILESELDFYKKENKHNKIWKTNFRKKWKKEQKKNLELNKKLIDNKKAGWKGKN